MTPQHWIAISAVVATVVTAALGLSFSFVTQHRQQERDDTLRKEQQKREDELRKEHREDAPHIELAINCQVLGQDDGHYLVEFTLMVYNRGLVRWTFRSIKLRVRGIEKNQQFAYWPGEGQRLEFPVKIINKEEVIPKSVNFLFVEPGVQQAIAYVTKIPAQIMYIVVYVEFWYDMVTPHTSERVFRLTAPAEST
jgi:hypothetical protein